MALLMTYLGAAQSVGHEMAPERVIDILLGVGGGTVMAVTLSTLEDRRHLAKHRRVRIRQIQKS